MVDKRNLEPEEGPHGVDRWSCNGYGLQLNGEDVKPVDAQEPDTDEIEEV